MGDEYESSLVGAHLGCSPHDTHPTSSRRDLTRKPHARPTNRDYQNLEDTEDLDEGGDGGTSGSPSAERCHYKSDNASEVDQEEEDDDVEDKTSSRLAFFCVLNFLYVVFQLGGAMAFGSLALLSDGFHNLSDV